MFTFVSSKISAMKVSIKPHLKEDVCLPEVAQPSLRLLMAGLTPLCFLNRICRLNNPKH